jgi:hypothetical protein
MDNSHPAILGGPMQIRLIAMFDGSLDTPQLFESRHLGLKPATKQFDTKIECALARSLSISTPPPPLQTTRPTQSTSYVINIARDLDACRSYDRA